MKHITLLDASLRDGGHRTQFHFKNEELTQILTPLDNSGIDYIEVGYRCNPSKINSSLGKASICDAAYLDVCSSLIKKSKMAVMVSPSHVSREDLNELKRHGVTLLRICVSKHEFDLSIEILEHAQSLGLQTAINLIQISSYTKDELDKALHRFTSHKPDMVYFADSNGSMMPEQVYHLFHTYTQKYTIPFGFHAHDNLGLAQANAIAAMNGGAQCMDVTLAGMGKGTGNLKTEFFIAYLCAIHVNKYNLENVLLGANYVKSALKIGHEPLSLDEFIRGLNDINTTDTKY